MAVQTLSRQFLIDDEGNRTAVVVPMHQWTKILSALEELDDIEAFDDAEDDDSEAIPFEQAMAEIERGEAG